MWTNLNFGGGGGGSGDLSNYATKNDLRIVDAKVATNTTDIEENTEAIANLSVSGSTFTNSNPSVITVGGIDKGTTFNMQTLTDMFNKLLYPEVVPTLTNPSHTFTENAPTLVEVGTATDITFTTNFNRGRINPAYGTSGYRSGLPEEYIYTGYGLPSKVESTNTKDTQSVTFLPTVPGITTWTSSVKYSEGEQPVTSTGTDFNTPLVAGTLTAKSVSVEAVYSFYATTADITSLTKQPLASGDFYLIPLIGEDNDGNKQVVEIRESIPGFTGVETFNIVTNKWEWLSGSKSNSMNLFSQSIVDRDGVSFRRYENLSAKIGARELRFYRV